MKGIQMKNNSSNKSFFNKIWNKFKNHLMVNFKTNDENERKQAHNYVDQAFDNQDNLFIMISNGLRPNNTKGSKVKLDENKIAEIIVNTVQPMIDKAFEKVKPMIDESLNTALKPINKRLDNIENRLSNLESDVAELKKDVKILKREAIKHGWDLSEDEQ